MATKRPRVLGGYTVFRWDNQTIAFANEVRTVSPEPVAAPQPIQPLDAQRPLEIVTSGASAAGTLTLMLTELYGETVWKRLAGITDAQDVVDIMRILAERDPANAIKIQKIVNPPIPGFSPYIETYYGCVVSRVADGETINISSMTVDKEVEVMYTHSLKDWVNGGARARPFTGV